MGFILISIAYNERSSVALDSLGVSEELTLLRECIIHDSHGSKSQIEHLHFGISLTVRVDDLFFVSLQMEWTVIGTSLCLI